MSPTEASAGKADAAASESDELARLRKQVRDLESEVSRLQASEGPDRSYRTGSSRPRGRYDRSRDDTVDTLSDFRDVPSRKIDEMARLYRGLTRATLEGFRVVANATSDAVDDVLTRNAPDADEGPVDALRRLPSDITRGIFRVVDDSMDIPSRSADALNTTFSDPDERGAVPSRRNRRSTGRSGSVYDARYEDWSTSDLSARAADLGVTGRHEMSRDELIAAIRNKEADSKPAARSSR